MNMNNPHFIIDSTDKYKKIYDELYGRYKDGELSDIIYLYALHEKLSVRDYDFDFIGKEVCRDILRKGNTNGES